MQVRAAILLLILLIINAADAQDFALKKIELITDGMILHYDLTDTSRYRAYTIDVYSSADNFESPLHELTGDVGLEVAPGFDRKITWHSKKELGASFHGEIELEIRGRAYIPFIKFNSFYEGRVVKRASPILLTWSGGSRQSILNFAIYKGNRLVGIMPNIPNSGNHELMVPADLKPGNDYYFQVTDSKNKDQVMRTPGFGIRRKVPLGVKATAAAMIALVAAIIVVNGRSHDLEGPPALPSSN